MASTSYELFLIRHGIAEARGDAWPDDNKRPLTERGITRMRKSARALAKLGMTIDVVLTSPLVRTRQTAEIVASAFDPRPAIVNVDSTVILERPKLKDYRAAIREKLAQTLELDLDRVSVKFKTAEKVGPVGEGRSAEARRR